MKIFQENINNFDNIDDVTVVIDPVTADALKEDQKVQEQTKDLIDPIIRAKSKPFLGAENQPVPSEAIETAQQLKLKLDESIFDDKKPLNESYVDKYGYTTIFVDNIDWGVNSDEELPLNHMFDAQLDEEDFLDDTDIREIASEELYDLVGIYPEDFDLEILENDEDLDDDYNRPDYNDYDLDESLNEYKEYYDDNYTQEDEIVEESIGTNQEPEIIDKVRSYLKDALFDFNDNIAKEIASEVDGYNPDWCKEEGFDALISHQDEKETAYIESILDVLFANNDELYESLSNKEE